MRQRPAAPLRLLLRRTCLHSITITILHINTTLPTLHQKMNPTYARAAHFVLPALRLLPA
jgi:hypothetical protein